MVNPPVIAFRRPSRVLFAGIGALLAVQGIGCGAPEAPPARLTLPAGWTPVDPQTVTVPGTPLLSWNGPGDASLTLYRTLAIPDPSLSALARETSQRYENFEGVTVQRADAQALPSGMTVARVEATGPGIGVAWVPTPMGTPVVPQGQTVVPTDRVLVGIPRAADTLWLVVHYPESRRGEARPVIDAAIASLVVDAGPRNVARVAD